MSDAPVVIVTAASQGIGEGIARDLAQRGYRLVLLARSDKVLHLAQELESVGLQGSVASEADLQAAVDTAIKKFGRIDGVVNNTGHAAGSSTPTGRRYDPEAGASLLEISDADWTQAFELLYMNIVRMARIVTPILLKQGRGNIVNISAFGERNVAAAYPASSTIRAAMSNFMKLYADRYARDGIRMNNVQPGYIENWEWSEAVVDSIPLGRPGRVAEVAQVVSFLLSEEASYMTGQSLTVDGGFSR